MVSHLFFYQLVLLGLLWLCLLLHYTWPNDSPSEGRPPATPARLHHKRTREPAPFAGLTHKPLCDACEHAQVPSPQGPGCPPPRLVSTRGRRRQVDTSMHFCPHPPCIYRGRWEALRAFSSRSFCPYDSRQVSLWYLSAGCRYTASCRNLKK